MTAVDAVNEMWQTDRQTRCLVEWCAGDVAVDSTMLPSDVSWNLYKALTTVESGEQLPLASDTATPHIAESLPRRTVSVGSEQSQIHTISSQSSPYSLVSDLWILLQHIDNQSFSN